MLYALAAEGATFDWSNVSTILTNVTDAFSLSNLGTVLGGILGITAGFGIFWFAVRKGTKLVQKAVKSGRITV